ncbi:MAG: tetratricopeptide repeat protein [Planctomycetes bacterium]|nr:tetratricopeptide repeat protein [Planctomycetota bacterium]
MALKPVTNWRAGWSGLAILAAAIAGPSCEKKPDDPIARRARAKKAISTSQPTSAGTALPEATRLGVNLDDGPVVFPSDLPTTTAIPKPGLSGLGRDVQKQLVAVYSDAVRAPTDAGKVGELGIYFFGLAAPTEAETCFALAASLEPMAIRWQLYLAMVKELAFDTAGAAQVLTKALGSMGDRPEGLLALADLRRASNPVEARQLYEKVLARTPNDARAEYGIGLCDLAEKKFDMALRRIKRAVELAPKYKDALLELTRLCEMLGDRQGSRMYAALAESAGPRPLGIDPDVVILKSTLASPERVYDIVEELEQKRQFGLAGDVLRRSIAVHPEAWDLRHRLGLIYAIERRFDEAAAELREVLNHAPDQTAVRRSLTQMLIESRQYAAADNVFKTLVSMRRDDYEMAMRYAEFLLSCGWPKDAYDALREAEISPTAARATELLRIEALVGMERPDIAIKRFVALRKSVKPPNILAESLAVDFTAIMTAQREADPSGFKRATLRRESIEKFAEAVHRDVGADDAAMIREGLDTVARLIIAEARRGEFAKSLMLVHRSAPSDSGGRIRDAFVRVFRLLREKDRKAADSALNDARRRLDNSISMSNAVAWLLATSPDDTVRDGRTAMEVATRCCQLTERKDPEILDTLAAAQAEAGQFDEAASTIRQALEIARKTDAVDSAALFEKRLSNYLNRVPYRVE